jgi:hypothetical protein
MTREGNPAGRPYIMFDLPWPSRVFSPHKENEQVDSGSQNDENESSSNKKAIK